MTICPQFNREIQDIRMEFRSIKLKWDSLQVNRNFNKFSHEVSRRWPDENSNGLYVFEGKQDGHREGTILYIGMTKRPGGIRVLESAKKSFYRMDEDITMYGSYWDLVMRWTTLDPDDTNLTKALESLLIVSMKPILNSKEINAPLREDAWDIVVSNTHDKGLILPMIHGDYFPHVGEVKY